MVLSPIFAAKLKTRIMKPIKFTISLSMLLLFVLSCSLQDSSKLGVVAERKGELIVCDPSLINKTITIPLSFFTEELQMVKLDNADEALVKESKVEMSENYILVKNSEQIPYKLFDKKTGKYITNIGSYGQGPGEYRAVYDQQLDEENNRIYLLPWDLKKIFAYDLKGNFLEAIPLCFNVPKGHMKVDTKAGTVIVSALPFEGTKAVVWQQTLKGELLKSVEPGHLAVQPDFSNEMGAFKSDNIFGFNIFTFFELRADSVYHYNVNQNNLIPVFTMDFKIEKPPIHSYNETKNFFVGDFSEMKQLDNSHLTTQNPKFYIVDKKSLKGAFFTLENDYLGGINVDYPVYLLSDDYFVYNTEPLNLHEKLEEVLSKNNNMTTEMRNKLTKLKESISDSENNYIFYAKYKQSASLDNISVVKVEEEPQISNEKSNDNDNIEISDISDSNDDDKIYGISEMNLIKNTPYLDNALEYFIANNKYKDWDPNNKKEVWLGFVVEKNGKASDIKVVKSCGIEELDKEAVRLIKEARHVPGTNNNGEPIRVGDMANVINFPPKKP